MNWYKNLKSKILVKEPASKHTTFKIGGVIPLWIEVFNLEELIFSLKKIKQKRLKFFIVGQASNILVPDKGLNRITLQLKSNYFKKVFIKDNYVIARAGVKVDSLINKCYNHSLSGLEFLTGIPATLGGALYMNAGIKGKSIGSFVKEVKVVTHDGVIRTLKKDNLNFSYRDGGFKDCIIVEAKIMVRRAKKEDILKRRKKFLENKKSQPLNYPNCGSIFKNPLDSNKTAGELIEGANLKGLRIGGAEVSLKHANYIINRENATAADVRKLIRLIQNRIKKLYDIKLETELIIL